MNRKPGILAGALLCLLALPISCLASPIVFTTTLSGSSEVPPNGSPATGFGTYTLDGDSLTVHEVFSGLTTNASAAHIHCCGAVGINDPVVLPFIGFPALTSGTYDHVFDLTAALTGIAESTFVAGMESGLAYANIHDTTFPAGEIRGQITASVAATPEPGSLLLVCTGILGVAAFVRWRLHPARALAPAPVEPRQ